MHVRVEDSLRIPLSPAQRDLLLESTSGAGVGAHAISTSLALPSDIGLDRWQHAAQDVFASQPGLQLKLIPDDRGPLQRWTARRVSSPVGWS
jgi:hypothetical protein